MQQNGQQKPKMMIENYKWKYIEHNNNRNITKE